MQEGWPDWARQAWRTLPPRRAEHARTVWTTLAREFDGVLVGPSALVRHLVDRGRLGHRSTLEALGILVDHDLLQARTAAEGTVLWIPQALMPQPDPGEPRPPRPSFQVTPRSNGSRGPAQAEA